MSLGTSQALYTSSFSLFSLSVINVFFFLVLCRLLLSRFLLLLLQLGFTYKRGCVRRSIHCERDPWSPCCRKKRKKEHWLLMSSCSGLLKAGKRRHPHTSMYEMVVNLYKSFVFSRTEGRDNKAHWLCADSANCWQEKKKKKSQASRYSRRVTRIDYVHTFLQRADVSEKHRRLPEPNRSILSLECMFFFFCHVDQHTLFIKKKVFGAVSLLWCIIPKPSLIISRFNCFSPCLLFCAGKRRTMLTVLVELPGSKASVLSQWTCSS